MHVRCVCGSESALTVCFPLVFDQGGRELDGQLVVSYENVCNGPNPELGKRVLDFILSDQGQAIWTNAYLQPSRPVELPADVASKFLPASDYERAVAVDYAAMERAQAGFGERYLSDVK